MVQKYVVTSMRTVIYPLHHPNILKQASHLGLIDLAAFMGLGCTPEQALKVWLLHQNGSPHRDYTTYGLPSDTLIWMNATMARLLPEPMALRWGITPTDL